MIFRLVVLTLLLIGLPVRAAAQQARAELNTGLGEGAVVVHVDDYGSFGSAVDGSDTSDAFFNPVGPFGFAGTTFESYIAFEEITPTSPSPPIFLTTGPRQALSPVGMTRDHGSLVSVFEMNDGLEFRLVQSLVPTFSGNRQTGSKLIQTYEVTNTTNRPRVLLLGRYLDGDLFFRGGFSNDLGGVKSGTPRTLFEFEEGESAEDAATFVGIQAFRGEDPAASVIGFEIDRFPLLRSRLLLSGVRGLRQGIFFGQQNADVDGDGDLDLVLHFPIQESAIGPSHEKLCLAGTLPDGIPFEGCDAITVVP